MAKTTRKKASRTPVNGSGATQTPAPDLAAQLAEMTRQRDVAVAALIGVADGLQAVRDKIVALVRPG